ncbi:UPF0236 family transposase-like protein [Candidatus Poribacteria bacterium]
MKIKVDITLTMEDDTEEERAVQVQIEESIPEGLQNLDVWEQNVRNMGFQTMRSLFRSGMELYEQEVLSGYEHKDKHCHVIRKGKLDFTLTTAMGKVRFSRKRMLCKTCGEWVTPINEALGLHDDEKERATLGFKELSSLCATNQPYRKAMEMMMRITQDPEIVSHEQIRLMVKREGRRLRQQEEKDRKWSVFYLVRDLLDRPYHVPTGDGKLYVCLDGIFVRSSSGKNRFHEGKVGFICTDEREPVGCKGRKFIPKKIYISSFENSYVLGGRVRGEALKLGLREYKEVFIIGDGARWIRKIREQYFPGTIYILDWFHLHEKLYEALRLTLPRDSKRRVGAFQEVSNHLWRGFKRKALEQLRTLRTQMLSEGMKQKTLAQREGLDELIAYIQNNWEGIVNYRQMQKDGYLVASSLVEKAADLLVAKRQKKKQGMHWTKMGADGICALRTLWMNDRWLGYWNQRRERVA